MKKILSLILSMVLMVSLFTGCKKVEKPTTTPDPKPVEKPVEKPTTPEADPIKLTVSEVTHSVFYAPQYLAIELGFFKDEGLDVELINGQGADKVMTSVIAGQAEIGLAGPEASVYLYNEGRENHSVLFAQLTKRDGSFLMGREPDPDFTWEKLRGKEIIGGRKGGMPEMTLEYVLRKNGIEPHKDITIDTSVQFALMAGAFTGGQGDYVTLFEPAASALAKEGKGYILKSIGEESGEIPYTAYFTSKEFMEKNPETIQKFTNAIYRAQLWIKDHTAAEITDKIIGYFPDTNRDIMIDVTQRHIDIDAWTADPVLTQPSIELMQEVMTQAGELKEVAPYDKIVNTEFAKKAIETIK